MASVLPELSNESADIENPMSSYWRFHIFSRFVQLWFFTSSFLHATLSLVWMPDRNIIVIFACHRREKAFQIIFSTCFVFMAFKFYGIYFYSDFERVEFRKYVQEFKAVKIALLLPDSHHCIDFRDEHFASKRMYNPTKGFESLLFTPLSRKFTRDFPSSFRCCPWKSIFNYTETINFV